MKINKVNINNIKTIYPNCSTIVFEDMNKDEESLYLQLYNFYRKLFSEYWIKKLNLKKYDKIISESSVKIQKNKEENMDIYQYFTANVLDYFYLRNNIYVERLNEKEKSFLVKKIKNKHYDLDDETQKMIECTYQKVILEDILGTGEKCITSFGPDNRRFFFDNGGIVIGINYDKYGDIDETLDEEKSIDLLEKQEEFINLLLQKMESEYKKIQTPIKIIEYNEFCIKPRNIDNNEKEDEKEK